MHAFIRVATRVAHPFDGSDFFKLNIGGQEAVLDASGHIQIFSFGIDGAILSLKFEFNRQKGRVADQAGQAPNAILVNIEQNILSS